MSNALTNAQQNGVAPTQNPFAAAGSGAGNVSYVKFIGAAGNYVAGSEGDELDPNKQFAADMGNSKWIWTFWEEGKVLDTVETLLVEDPMGYKNEPNTVPAEYSGDMTIEEIRAAQKNDRDFKDGWGVQASLGMREFGGEGDEYIFRFGQGVAMNGFRALANDYGRKYLFQDGKMPIVSLGTNKYKAKAAGVGWRYAPVLKIEDWKSEQDLLAGAGGDASDYDDSDNDAPKQIEETKEATPARRGAGRGRGNRNV